MRSAGSPFSWPATSNNLATPEPVLAPGPPILHNVDDVARGGAVAWLVRPTEVRWGRRTSSAGQGGLVTVRGVLQIHSAPPALSPHIEWALAGVFGMPVKLQWIDQPAAPGSVRAELAWQGQPGLSGEITSALASWDLLRFEVTEEASQGCDAVRYSCTPALGIFSATVGANGDIMISENRLRAVLTLAASAPAAAPGPRLGTLREVHGPRHPALGGSVEAELSLLLGEPWDAELEPFRHASAGAPVRWLHATG
jgi:hypothetical protein